MYDLENGGVGLTDMEYTRDFVGEETIQKLDELKEQIISGEIQVTDVFEEE